MEKSKICAMMYGKTLEKDNIQKMHRMVSEASDLEEKKNVKKHSVLFVGQLPLKDQTVDLNGTRRILNASMPYDEVEPTLRLLLEGLTVQKLLLKEGDTYKLNMRYEKTIVKARKIARVYRNEMARQDPDAINRAKKLYQKATRLYNRGDYEEALENFLQAARTAEHRMAYYSLGMMYARGLGCEKSPKEALYYLRKAIVLGAEIAVPLEEEMLAQLQTRA